jgi:hypothetical protein
MPKRDLTFNIEGHPGHRGNALAHALVEKLRRLLSALGQAERKYDGKPARQTEYEVVAATKVNPTKLTLHPVSKQANYDPIPAFEWTFEQIERVALGKEVDDRVDSILARTLAEIAEKKREDDYSRLWINIDDRTVDFDEQFRARSVAIAARKAEQEQPPAWFAGTSYGSVVGDLREVSDIDGEHHFVIIPPIGAQRINCIFPEGKREEMRQYLFRLVRVIGKLYYTKDSPFPVQVDMADIEYAATLEQPAHLLQLRGLFSGFDRRNDNLETLLDGL